MTLVKSLPECVNAVKALGEFTGKYYNRDSSKYIGGYSVFTVPPTGNRAYNLLEVRIFSYGYRVKWVAWLSVNGTVTYRQGIVTDRLSVINAVCLEFFNYYDSCIANDYTYMEDLIIPTIGEFMGHDRPVMWTENHP